MTIYLSRLFLNNGSHTVRMDLGDCHRLHRRILAAFPPAQESMSARSEFSILYRAEPIQAKPMLTRLLIQSALVPDWSHLPRSYLSAMLDGSDNPSWRSIGEQYDKIAAGTQYIFRLRANPTKRISDRNPLREDLLCGKRVDLRGEEQQINWLRHKGKQHGFRLLDTLTQAEVAEVQAAVGEKTRGWRPKHEDKPAMRLSFGAVVFNGRLEVTEKDLFIQALRVGIGSGKAFGFGLLSIASQH